MTLPSDFIRSLHYNLSDERWLHFAPLEGLEYVARGTNVNETVHMHLRKWLSGGLQTLTMFEASLQLFMWRYNMRDIRNEDDIEHLIELEDYFEKIADGSIGNGRPHVEKRPGAWSATSREEVVRRGLRTTDTYRSLPDSTLREALQRFFADVDKDDFYSVSFHNVHRALVADEALDGVTPSQVAHALKRFCRNAAIQAQQAFTEYGSDDARAPESDWRDDDPTAVAAPAGLMRAVSKPEQIRAFENAVDPLLAYASATQVLAAADAATRSDTTADKVSSKQDAKASKKTADAASNKASQKAKSPKKNAKQTKSSDAASVRTTRPARPLPPLWSPQFESWVGKPAEFHAGMPFPNLQPLTIAELAQRRTPDPDDDSQVLDPTACLEREIAQGTVKEGTLLVITCAKDEYYTGCGRIEWYNGQLCVQYQILNGERMDRKPGECGARAKLVFDRDHKDFAEVICYSTVLEND